MTVLDEIVAKKRQEIAAAKAARPLAELQKEARDFRVNRRPFRTLFDQGPVLIAEIKPKSPSAGELIPKYGHAVSIFEIADLYGKSETDAISALTDEKYFGGSIELLKEVRSRVPQAVFRKDFIIDEYQVYETLLSGADAFLLIATILEEETLVTLMKLGQELGLEYLVEVHDEKDVEKALRAGGELIGINNRDLASLKIDIETTHKLLGRIPKNIPVVSESGIESAADVRKVREWGARGILVGTSILISPNPLEKISQLKEALIL